MRKFIPCLLELTIYSIILLQLWRGYALLEWLAGYPPADDQLLVAAAAGDSEMFEKAFSGGASVNAHDENGGTALMTAAAINRVGIARSLIERGADVNAIDDQGGTALIYAAEAGRIEMTRLLLAHGADASHRGPQGQTARELALLLGHPDAAALLPDSSSKG